MKIKEESGNQLAKELSIKIQYQYMRLFDFLRGGRPSVNYITSCSLARTASIYKEIKMGYKSRAKRLAEAEALVENAKSIVEELKDELENWKDNLPESLQSSNKADQLEEAISGLEDIVSSLEDVDFSSVEFPGMYG
jgi:methyl-accepting chemotaxis protein